MGSRSGKESARFRNGSHHFGSGASDEGASNEFKRVTSARPSLEPQHGGGRPEPTSKPRAGSANHIGQGATGSRANQRRQDQCSSSRQGKHKPDDQSGIAAAIEYAAAAV